MWIIRTKVFSKNKHGTFYIRVPRDVSDYYGLDIGREIVFHAHKNYCVLRLERKRGGGLSGN